MNHQIILISLILALLFLSTTAFLLWERQNFEPELYYYVPPERSFIYESEEMAKFGFEEYIREKITTEKARLINDKKSFIYLDFRKMELTLYQEGEIFQVFPIESKGREGTWWETAPGAYFVGDKVVTHFSSIARVWIPYGIQFYGNFFIHGWPYDSWGRPLLPGPSGGCIRLKTEDAAVVFKFAERGMPVLVFEEKIAGPLPALIPPKDSISFPELSSENFMVADLDTGEILLSKEFDSEIHPGPLTSVMMALTGSEIINMERRITAKSWMIEDVEEKIILPERSYRALDLLEPLLLRSSKEAALVLSYFFTPEYFLAAMNVKAKAIGMNNTSFVDVTGASEKNITTLHDTAKMMKYIQQYRGFILEINRELKDEKTGFAVFKMDSPEGFSRSIFIALVNSDNIEKDMKNVILWLNNNLKLNKI